MGRLAGVGRDRCRTVVDVIDRFPRLAVRAAAVRQRRADVGTGKDLNPRARRRLAELADWTGNP
ncbi:hypothetical protein [Streptomyces sp. NPDC001914]|uniref:hypothetical protein n=1 Tax=Streptomyces sp. NPDC001914 TaxID=3364623 RepID=UPI00369FA198